MSLRFKLLSGFFVLIIIPLFLLGTVAFFVSQHMIQQKYTQLNEVTLKAAASNVNNVIDEVNHLSVAAIANPTVQRILSLDTENMTDTERQLNTIDAEKTLRKILYTYPFVYSVILYDSNGVAYKVGHYDSQAVPYKKLVEHPVYQDVLEKDGLPVWVGPYQYPDLIGNAPVLTQIRIVKNVDTLQNKGILILQTKLNGVGGVFDKISKDNRFLLASDDGLIFYDNRQDLQGKTLQQESPASMTLSSKYQTSKRNFNGEESLVSVYGLSLENWRILSVQSWHSLSKEMTTIVQWITGITALSLMAALLFNILFVNRIARPIIDVVHAMKGVEEGDLYANVKVERSGETRKLTAGFNSLVIRVRHLLEEMKTEQRRKQKAEKMLLQAQIRPHFLLNTLESINVLAVQNEGRKVSRMIHKLGQILRISMEASEEVTVREEVTYLNSYLTIQKYRFENVFDYHIDVAETVMDDAILKLTLQPLVENAIQHAFEGIEHKGEIKIRAVERPEQIEFFVSDNGHGISDRVLYHLQFDDQKNETKKQGLGIQNVADRLRIHYGNAYGLLICSSKGEGTMIKCFIPKYNLEDQDGTD